MNVTGDSDPVVNVERGPLAPTLWEVSPAPAQQDSLEMEELNVKVIHAALGII